MSQEMLVIIILCSGSAQATPSSISQCDALQLRACDASSLTQRDVAAPVTRRYNEDVNMDTVESVDGQTDSLTAAQRRDPWYCPRATGEISSVAFIAPLNNRL
jgi:hypothetical protein